MAMSYRRTNPLETRRAPRAIIETVNNCQEAGLAHARNLAFSVIITDSILGKTPCTEIASMRSL
jgi:hypothetical protein